MLHVNVATGELCHSKIDFSLPGFIRLEFERSYKSQAKHNGLFGWHWRHPLDSRLITTPQGFSYLDPSSSEIALDAIEETPEGLLGKSADGSFTLYRFHQTLALNTPDLRTVTFALDGPQTATGLPPLSVHDANGNDVAFTYDERGLLQNIRDSLGRRILCTYNTRGKLTEFQLAAREPERLISLARYSYSNDDDLVMVQDSSGNVYRYEYHDHLLISITNPLGGSYYARYDQKRRCLAVWGEGGFRQRILAYDDRRRVTRVVNALSAATDYKINEAGLVIEEINALGGSKTTLYDSNNAVLAVLNEKGHAQTATLYNPETRTLTVTDAAGAATVFVDNDRGKVESMTDAGGGTWKWQYDERGNLVRITRPSGAEAGFEYDRRGFAVGITDSSGNVIRQTLSLDGKRLVVEDKLGRIMDLEYDDLGNLVAATDGNGTRTEIIRNPAGRLVAKRWPDGTALAYEYDGDGNMTKQINELGKETILQYDAYGLCRQTTGPLGETIQYTYDLEGNPVTIVNERGEIHRFFYDLLERVIKQIFFDGSEEQYRYDELGNIAEVIDGEGRRTQITYNEVNAMIEKRYYDGSRDHFAYDGLRRLTDLSNQAISIHLEWDAAGNLVQEIQGDRTLDYAYDQAGNLRELKDSAGRKIAYSYDERHRLVSINDNAAGQYRFTYDLANLLIAQRFPNGFVLRNDYDQRRRFVGQSVLKQASVIAEKCYRFDAADRLTATIDRYPGGNEITKEFSYDELERLTAVTTNQGVPEEYVYDPVGNVVYSSELGPIGYRRGNLVEQTPFGPCLYDRNGALVKTHTPASEVAFSYDGAGRLANVVAGEQVIAEYTYDPFGRRITKTSNGLTTSYTWHGFTLLEEAGSGTTKQYLFDVRSWIPLAQAVDGKVEHFFCDRRGCVFATVNGGEGLTSIFDYSAFGTMRSPASACDIIHPFRLRGQYYDDETGLHYNFHRYYQPATGAFITRDPLGIDAGRHLYRYGPNPLTWEDPFGLNQCQGDVFYRAMSDAEKQKVMADCQLHAKESKCPEGPYVTQNKDYCQAAHSEKPDKYPNLVEICTQPGTASTMTSSPFACRNGSQAAYFPSLPDVISGNPDRIEHKMERGGLNYGLSKGKGLQTFNRKVHSMKVVGTNETCTK